MKLWYAVLENKEDNEWGYGSYDLREAEKMALNMGTDAFIAVIQEGTDPICVREINQEDFSITTMYAIRDVAYDHDMNNEDTDRHIFEASDAKDIIAELDRIGADDVHFSIEEYRVDEEGEFYDGSDYDTPSNFRKRTTNK